MVSLLPCAWLACYLVPEAEGGPAFAGSAQPGDYSGSGAGSGYDQTGSGTFPSFLVLSHGLRTSYIWLPAWSSVAHVHEAGIDKLEQLSMPKAMLCALMLLVVHAAAAVTSSAVVVDLMLHTVPC